MQEKLIQLDQVKISNHPVLKRLVNVAKLKNI
ncbi:hypothetical protein Pse7367_2673 [Thalassoporum mexicanum PCC 7367]|nr:hypothetical protein Pse7367_2673 [Pseudanabaena sp. PCC 7367]